MRRSRSTTLFVLVNNSAARPKIAIDRILDVARPADRESLVGACIDDDVKARVAGGLDLYLRYFKANEWRKVYSGGFVTGPKGAGVYELTHLVDVASVLETLSNCEGFDRLLAGLENVLQVGATLFEIEVAGWCSTRTVHADLVFSPAVERHGSTKRPEFKWLTDFGELWCECKHANLYQSKRSTYLQRLQVAVGGVLEALPITDNGRLDVTIPGATANRVEDRLKQAVRSAIHRWNDGERNGEAVRVGEVEAVVRARNLRAPHWPGSFRVAEVTVTTSPTPLNEHSARVTITMDISAVQARQVRALLRQARGQLPLDQPSAVFLGGVGLQTASAAVATYLKATSNSIVWIAVCSDDNRPDMVHWRPGQPFDRRLILPDTPC